MNGGFSNLICSATNDRMNYDEAIKYLERFKFD
jgi:hypothetical protein